MSDSTNSPRSLPDGALVAPALVLLGIAGMALKIAGHSGGPSGMADGILIICVGIPGALCFLGVYFWAFRSFRRRRPQWQTWQLAAVATLLGFITCAVGLGVLVACLELGG